MNIQTSRIGGTFVACITGRMDSSHAEEIGACLAAADDARSNILIDLQDVDYISSAGIRVLLIALKRRLAVGKRLSCCAVRPSIREVLDMVGLSAQFDLHASQDAYFAKAVQVTEPSPEQSSLQQKNKETVLRFLMAIQFRQFAEFSALAFEGMTTTHTPSLAAGLDGHQFASAADYGDFLKDLNKSKDLEIVIQSMIAEDDLVAVHNISTHTYADGRSMTTPYMSFYRLRDGKIVEANHVYDRLHEQSQLA